MQNYKTPIQQLTLRNNANAVYIKRDDLVPISFGGNKARKALLFFDDILKTGCDIVVTYGSSSSNHCRIIANMAVSRSMKCIIVTPDERSEITINSILTDLFGAERIICPVSEVNNTINDTLKWLKSNGRRPYFIHGGGHGNIGTQAYVNCYREIREYEFENNIHFDLIFLASGTGTTQAGLVCGQLLDEDDRDIIGISIARNRTLGHRIILDSVYEYADGILESMPQKAEGAVHFIDDYIMGGYGDYNQDILNVIKEVLLLNGIPLDTTYTGKAFFGMQKYLDKNKVECKSVLFIHTGGIPIFFDKLKEL
jgi:D-cysteine desulfhydrase